MTVASAVDVASSAAAQAGLRVAVFEAHRIGAGATVASMGHLVTIDEDPMISAGIAATLPNSPGQLAALTFTAKGCRT